MNNRLRRLWIRWTLLVGLPLVAHVRGAGALVVETNALPVEWVVRHGDRVVFRYAYAPGRFKPYVQELATFEGRNLLRDAPADHLHHHALMYAIAVNGLNFWEEAPGAGVQKPITSRAESPVRRPDGRSAVRFVQRLHWVAPADAFLPDTTSNALLVEDRTLTLEVDEARREVALEWVSEFEAGRATNVVALTGSSYFGLGVRFLAELDPVADHFTQRGRLDLSNGRQDVSEHPWAAVAFAVPNHPATLAVFGHPDNPGGDPWYFSMKTPFAYLAATQHLDQEPLRYQAGDRFTLRYLIIVMPTVAGPADLEARRQRWLGERR